MRRLFLPMVILGLLAGTVLCALAATNAPQRTVRAFHQDVACAQCHGKGPQTAYSTPFAQACLQCHGSSADVAKRTAALDERNLNPHNSYHYGMDMDCMTCHRQHTPSYDACNQCHDFRQWMKPTP